MMQPTELEIKNSENQVIGKMTGFFEITPQNVESQTTPITIEERILLETQYQTSLLEESLFGSDE